MKKLIIFDLDDCLIDTWNASFPESLELAINQMIKKGLKIKEKEKSLNQLIEINKKSNNTEEAMKKFLEKENQQRNELVEIGKESVHKFNLKEKIKPMKGANELLNKLNNQGHELAIVTKGKEETQMNKIEWTKINKKLLKKILIVNDYNKEKPYKKLMKELKFLPKETFVVGDRYKTDLKPAKKIGCKVIWIPHGRGKVHKPKKEEIDFEIKNLMEISKLIK